ncbi:MAG: DUF805 domain-containing protein [Akkermansiaceae bacterium]|nr:DUF805 domain-containing protein [Akkermansiaceae bacterium]
MISVFKFSGKSDRFEWWVTSVVTGLVSQLSIIFLAFSSFETGRNIFASIALGVVAWATIWILAAVTAKRFRDCGYSPWLTILGVIPFVCFAVVVVCGFFPSDSAKKRKLVTRVVE